jgi:hypothetical protein
VLVKPSRANALGDVRLKFKRLQGSMRTPQPNLVTGMKWLLGKYTSRFNRRHGEFGHVQ